MKSRSTLRWLPGSLPTSLGPRQRRLLRTRLQRVHPLPRRQRRPRAHREAPARPAQVPNDALRAPAPSREQLCEADDSRATERMVSLLDHLDRVGDDLHLDQLHAVLREITACQEAMWRPLGSPLARRAAAWRAHAEAIADRPTFREICALADRVRWALGMAAARTARPFTWMQLGERLDPRLPALHPDDKVSVLVEVDRGTCSDRPLLSALITARANRVHPLYGQVLDHLDRPVPAPEEAQTSWEGDFQEHRRLRRGTEKEYRVMVL